MAPIGAVRVTGRPGQLRGLCGDFVLVWLSVSSKRSDQSFSPCRRATIALTAALVERCDIAVWTCRAFAELYWFCAERSGGTPNIANFAPLLDRGAEKESFAGQVSCGVMTFSCNFHFHNF